MGEIKLNSDFVRNIAIGGLGIAAVAIYIRLARNVNKANDNVKVIKETILKANKKIEEMTDIQVAQEIVDNKVDLITQEKVNDAVKKAVESIKNETSYEIKNSVSRELDLQKGTLRKRVAEEIAREAKDIRISDLEEEVLERAKDVIADRLEDKLNDILNDAEDAFNDKLENILDKYNDNLNNVGRIYDKLASRMSKDSDSSKDITLKLT